MSLQHRLAGKDRLTVRDLYGENLMMIRPKWSREMDALRGHLMQFHPQISLQGYGIGADLLEYAVTEMGAASLWALEKNTRAIRFYQRHGFRLTGEKRLEDGTSEYLVQMRK